MKVNKKIITNTLALNQNLKLHRTIKVWKEWQAIIWNVYKHSSM